ncbi:MAG: hypothetical protein IPP86_07065 [Bacteroidetes bacterium]|nr:hypothetical protein [Bacteroidota bacterium]
MITSQVPVKQWFDLIGKKQLLPPSWTALFHDSIRIGLKGDLWERKTETVGNEW